MTDVTLVHNPTSGTGRHDQRHLIGLLARSGHQVRYLSTKEADLDRALRRPGDMVVAAGGDGTVAKVIRALNGRHVPVGVLPFGTANNIARALRLRRPISRIVAGWRPERHVSFDLAVVEGVGEPQVMVESLGIGAFAAAAQALHLGPHEAGGPREALTHARQFLAKALKKAKPIEKLAIDGKKMPGVLFVEVLNIPLVGPGLRLCRQAHFDDGLVDVVYGEEKHRKAMVEWLTDGAHPAETPGLPAASAKSLAIRFSSAVWRLDDTFFDATGKKTKLTVTVRPGGIRMMTPHLPRHWPPVQPPP